MDLTWCDRKAVWEKLQRMLAKPVGPPSLLPSAGAGEDPPTRRLPQLKVVDFSQLDYDEDLGRYCYEDQPFSGIATQQYPNGELDSLVHYLHGHAHGVSVAWYPGGQISLYNEVAGGVRHGLRIEWAEDGTKQVEQHFNKGRLTPKGGKTHKRTTDKKHRRKK